jgi:hypothetical protein
MKTTYKLSPMVASTIALCYESARAALTAARDITCDKEAPFGVQETFRHVAAVLRTPLERIEKGIPAIKKQEFNEHIVDVDPMAFKNIQYLWSRMPKEKKEMFELLGEALLRGESIEIQDEKVKQMPKVSDNDLLEAIIRAITESKGVSENKLCSKGRYRYITYPRQLIMYIARNKTKLTHDHISKRLKRDHSTCVDSVSTIQDLIETDEKVRADVEYFMSLDYTQQEQPLKIAV